MLAYFVHDSEQQTDTVLIPDMGCSVPVDADLMEAFISVDPDFANWSGNACADLKPEDFGTLVATREDSGDVCVVDQELWRQRMEHYLGKP